MGQIKHSILSALVSVILLLTSSNNLHSKPSVRITTKYYDISGTSSEQLKAQMMQRGPKGFWAYASWYVRWSGSCKISLDITYTLPRWNNKKNAPASLRQKWHRMIRNLRRHEEGHGKNGINAAREIEATRCRKNPKGITRKWARQDKIYDRRTDHGRTEGVKF